MFLIPSFNICFSLWSPLWPLLPHHPTHRRLPHHQCPHRTPQRLLPRHRLYLHRVHLTNQIVDHLFHSKRQEFLATNVLRLIVPADSIQFILATCFIMGDTRSSENSVTVHSLLSGLPKIPVQLTPFHSPFISWFFFHQSSSTNSKSVQQEFSLRGRKDQDSWDFRGYFGAIYLVLSKTARKLRPDVKARHYLTGLLWTSRT